MLLRIDRRTRSVLTLAATATLISCGGSTEPDRLSTMTALPGTTPQSGMAGAPVALVPGVRIVSANGSGVPNVEVTFVVASGGGSVVGAAVKTDASGMARAVSWTLGPVAGTNTLTATASGSAAVTFTATAVGHPIAAALSARLTGIGGRPFGIRMSDGGVMAITQQDLNSVTLTDAANVAPKAVNVGADPGDVVFNSTGTLAYVSAFNSGTITIVDVPAGTPVATVPIASNAYRLALAPDDSKLFVTSTDGHVYVVNLSTLSVSSLALSGALNGCALDASGRYLYVSATGGAVWKVDVPTLSVVATTNQGGQPQDVVVAPNGSQVYVANEFGWIDVLDASTLVSTRRILMIVGAPFGLAVTPDGKYLYVTSSIEGSLDIIDVATNEVVKTFAVGGVPRRVTFDRFGLAAFVANENNYVDVIR